MPTRATIEHGSRREPATDRMHGEVWPLGRIQTAERPAVGRTGVSSVPILSFFTGLGFLDQGFMQAGFQVAWHNELEPWFIRGFEHGMSALTDDPRERTVQNTRSVVDVGPHAIMDEAFDGLGRPEVFGVIGGPPCQNFSVGGKNAGGDGQHGSLSLVYVQRILALRPTFFLFENVAGLARTGKHREFLAHLKGLLVGDYALSVRILNALDHGVPQDRERLFMVGFSRTWLRRELGFDAGSEDRFPWPHDPRYEDAKSRFPWPGRDPFGSDPARPLGIPEELMVGPLVSDPAATAALPNGTECLRPKSDKLGRIDEGDVSRKSSKRLHRWRFSPTAAYGHNEVHLHPTEPRRLTVREAMRIQTVPDAYALPAEMPLTRKFRAIGNGVPVGLARAMAGAIASVLEGRIGEVAGPR